MNDYQDENNLIKVTLLHSYIVRIFRKEEDGYLISKKKYDINTFKDEFKFNPYEFSIAGKIADEIVDPVGFGSKFIRHCKEIRNFIKNNDMTKFELNTKYKKNSFTITIINSKTKVVELKILVSKIAVFIEEKIDEYPKTFEDTDNYQPPVIKSPVNFTLDTEELLPVYRALLSGIEDMYINNWSETNQAEIVTSVSDRLQRLIGTEILNIVKPTFTEIVNTELNGK